MAKSKALIAAEARLVVAATVYHNQRARIAELEALLATRGVITTAIRTVAQPIVTPIVTQFQKRDGSVWQSTRVGNRTTYKELSHV